MDMTMNASEINQLSNRVIGAAIEVHRALGPGLLESVYETCLMCELNQMGIAVERQVEVPVEYKGKRIECGFRADMVINESIIMELKSVDALQPIHEAQLITYLGLSGYRLGLLMNFNEKLLKNGIKRLINNLDNNG